MKVWALALELCPSDRRLFDRYNAHHLFEVIKAGFQAGRNYGHDRVGVVGRPAGTGSELFERAEPLSRRIVEHLPAGLEGRLLSAANKLGTRRRQILKSFPPLSEPALDGALEECLLFGVALALLDRPELITAQEDLLASSSVASEIPLRSAGNGQSANPNLAHPEASRPWVKPAVPPAVARNDGLQAAIGLLVAALIAGGFYVYKLRQSVDELERRVDSTPPSTVYRDPPLTFPTSVPSSSDTATPWGRMCDYPQSRPKSHWLYRFERRNGSLCWDAEN